jgi:hypothetical protein
MIVKDLFFNYNLNYNKVYNLALEDNDEFIKIIPEIVFYEKGNWINNKRNDYAKINISDIPYELRFIIDIIKDNKGLIGIKIKIKKEVLDDKIIIKTKLILNGFIGTLINNLVNLRSTIIINNDENIKTNINVNYNINSIFMNEEISNMISYHIQKKLENYYIKIIDKYFSEIT